MIGDRDSDGSETPATDSLEIGRWSRDDDLIDAATFTGGTRVRVTRPSSVSVVIGSGSDPWRELHVEACIADRVQITRRRGGGCAVVLDRGNIIVSVARPLAGLGGISSHFAWISAWLCHELSELGIHGVTRAGVSDLARGGNKIGGSCIFRRKDLIYYSTTLLVAPRIDLIERYLQHPPREPDYRKGRTHCDFLGTLSGSENVESVTALLERLRSAVTAESLELFPQD